VGAVAPPRIASIMNPPSLASVRSRLETLIALAGLLERIEQHGMVVGAEQYRQLVARLKRSLGEELPDDALQAVLAAHPATAELYENLHYERSGLSRSSLDRSVASEMLAAEAIERARRRRLQ
jgi:hypothetical protein